ncbi:MAG: M23 family metallopeptidase [Arenimonas sp.]|uniref:M23 family metallopeptidase n=1 Tax=Arenimonas sp. TaxID=1872635 RepID=UPI0025C18F16|nr:M23 family metallopeptidase [Arenimonas sp.]MBW8366439.1 M23 family metallopeptidase [Arenimonas sp.]
MSRGRLLALLLALSPALAHPQSGRPVDLVMVRQGQSWVAYADNRLGGPVEVELSATELTGVITDATLPLRHVLPARQRVAMLRLTAEGSGGRHALQLDATPGAPGQVARDVVYSLPVDESRFELGQGFHGGFSHQDEANRYALDLIVAEGTPVLAARDGVVMQAISGYREGGADRALAARANQIRILHEDGSMALYAHLQEAAVYVNAGDEVTLGQMIGRTGNTGFSSGPHLHFSVQVNGGMRLVSIPFRMIGPDGLLPLQH